MVEVDQPREQTTTKCESKVPGNGAVLLDTKVERVDAIVTTEYCTSSRYGADSEASKRQLSSCQS